MATENWKINLPAQSVKGRFDGITKSNEAYTQKGSRYNTSANRPVNGKSRVRTIILYTMYTGSNWEET